MNANIQQDRVNAARGLGVDKLSALQHAATRLAMLETQKRHADFPQVERLCKRWNIGRVVSFYWSHTELWFTN